ncbi:MAG: O-antigen polysaccharide polymerase Wzy [Nonlabens sp.]
MLRNIFIIAYLTIVALLYLNYNAAPLLWLSFFLNTVILTFITYYHIFLEKRYSPFLSTYIVFTFLFFTVAPILQSMHYMEMENPLYDHKFPYKEDLFIKTNGLIALFQFVFFISYIALKTRLKTKSRVVQNRVFHNKSILIRNIVLLLVVSIIIIGIGFPFLIDAYVRHNWEVSSYSPGFQLIFNKTLFTVPIAAIVLAAHAMRGKVSTQTWIVALVLGMAGIALCLLLKNPFTEKRNALGPVYILILYLFMPRLFNSNVKTSFFMFFLMIVAFPVIQILTHLEWGIADIIDKPSRIFAFLEREDFSKGFLSLNYDAFANIGIAIEEVTANGFSYGYQFLSALLFFVPRTLWPGKPDSSGLILGNRLIDEYGFNFANISNPLVSEGYMNYGLFGVVLMAFLFAVTVVVFIKWLSSGDPLKRATAFYFAMHIIFLLRGDFTNGYSYFIGVLFGLFVIPKTLIKLSTFFLDTKIAVKS